MGRADSRSGLGILLGVASMGWQFTWISVALRDSTSVGDNQRTLILDFDPILELGFWLSW